MIEHLASYFKDFGVEVNIGGALVTGIFDNAYQEAFGLVPGTTPSLLLPDASASLAAAGETLAVGGVFYTVVRVELDGTGLTRLGLERA